ncbi:MAG: hypothetical protein V4612_07075 [Pseudomonadota bacterium]
MYKLSEILLDVLEEMEFLTRTLNSAQLYYADISEALSAIIKETKMCVLNATLDLAIDLNHKINHQIDKSDFTEKIAKNLNEAAQNLQHFPKKNKIASFANVELELAGLIDFIQEYSLSSHHLIKELSAEEKKLLINKTLAIKSRRTI